MTDQRLADSNPGKHPKGKGCWYFHSIEVCVLCGGTMHEYRERRWDEKPADPLKRFEYRENAHAGHFS